MVQLLGLAVIQHTSRAFWACGGMCALVLRLCLRLFCISRLHHVWLCSCRAGLAGPVGWYGKVEC